MNAKPSTNSGKELNMLTYDWNWLKWMRGAEWTCWNRFSKNDGGNEDESVGAFKASTFQISPSREKFTFWIKKMASAFHILANLTSRFDELITQVIKEWKLTMNTGARCAAEFGSWLISAPGLIDDRLYLPGLHSHQESWPTAYGWTGGAHPHRISGCILILKMLRSYLPIAISCGRIAKSRKRVVVSSSIHRNHCLTNLLQIWQLKHPKGNAQIWHQTYRQMAAMNRGKSGRLGWLW